MGFIFVVIVVIVIVIVVVVVVAVAIVRVVGSLAHALFVLPCRLGKCLSCEPLSWVSLLLDLQDGSFHLKSKDPVGRYGSSWPSVTSRQR